MSNEKNEVGFTAQHQSNSTAESKPKTQDGTEQSPFQKIADELGKLVTEKNKAYGSAHIVSGRIMCLLFPTGIHPHRVYDALLMVRIIDKLMRLATRPTAFGESPYMDIAGYGILGLDVDRQRPNDEAPKPQQQTKDAVSTSVVGEADPLNETLAHTNTTGNS